MITGCGLPPIYGLSTDQRPENMPNGQKLILIDTGEIKYYDEENDKWLQEDDP